MPTPRPRALLSLLLWGIVFALTTFALSNNVFPAEAASDPMEAELSFEISDPTPTPGWDWDAINARIKAGTGGPVCAIREDEAQSPPLTERQPAALCVGGTASGFPCQNVDLLAHLPLNQIGGGSGNDIWGWSYFDSNTGTTREFALMGRTNGTAFVEITNPESPVYLGNLPSHTGSSSWRDIKVYELIRN